VTATRKKEDHVEISAQAAKGQATSDFRADAKASESREDTLSEVSQLATDSEKVAAKSGDDLRSETRAGEETTLSADENSSDEGAKQVDDEDESADAYGLLAEIEEETDDPLGLQRKGEELLFGLKSDPFAAGDDQAEDEPPPPPLPVVGIRLAYGAPAYAPLSFGVEAEAIDAGVGREDQNFSGVRPIGLNGPFTVDPAQSVGLRGAKDDEEDIAVASLFSRTSDDENQEFALDRVGNSASEAQNIFAKGDDDEDDEGTKGPLASSLDFGLSDKTRVTLGTNPRRTTAVISSRSDGLSSNLVGPTSGNDEFRAASVQPGPFGSTGAVARVISAYLRSSSSANAESGRVVSTLG
jgi:hypothetical protein